MNRNNNKNNFFQPNIQNKYSIRKFSVGIASILVGSFLVFGVNNEAHAAEVKDEVKDNFNTSDKQNKDENNKLPSTNLDNDKAESLQVNNGKKNISQNDDKVDNVATSNEELNISKNSKLQKNEQKADNNDKTSINKNTQQVDISQSFENEPDKKQVKSDSKIVENDKTSDIDKNVKNKQTEPNNITTVDSTKVVKKRVRRDISTSDDQLAGDFVFSGTSSSDKRYNITSDLINNRHETNTSFSFTGSGHGAINNGKLVYEAPKKFIMTAPTFSNSEYVTKKTDLSDNDM